MVSKLINIIPRKPNHSVNFGLISILMEAPG